MKDQFEEIIIKDNFYQSSSFFPMPLTLIGTLNEDKTLTSFGSYSLIFPYYIAGKQYYAMVLECRNTSNTAKGILRHGKCTINFLPYSKKNFAQHVACGFPGDTPEEKMKDFRFHPVDSFSSKESKEPCPKILEEALQVFECTWMKELDHAENDQVLDEYEGPYTTSTASPRSSGPTLSSASTRSSLSLPIRKRSSKGPPVPTSAPCPPTGVTAIPNTLVQRFLEAPRGRHP